ncbi:hypothetical protein Dimus_013341 [Dionaea muscipula]
MKKKDERIPEFQGKLRKEAEDHQAIMKLLKEEEEKLRGLEAEAEQLKEKGNDSQRRLAAEQSEKAQLRGTIQAGRVFQRNLKDSLEEYLAEAEGMSVQHYIKTKEFKTTMARLNSLWYAAVEDELVKAEQTRIISLDMLDWLDPKKKGSYVFPEVELFPEELIPKLKLGKRSPLEIMKDWSVGGVA